MPEWPTTPEGEERQAREWAEMLGLLFDHPRVEAVTAWDFTDGCWLFFGKETAGLPEAFRLAYYDRCIRLPMRSAARSLNLSNSVAILTYEALRQTGFPGLTGTGEMACEE